MTITPQDRNWLNRRESLSSEEEAEVSDVMHTLETALEGSSKSPEIEAAIIRFILERKATT